jgi:hypothetical protein
MSTKFNNVKVKDYNAKSFEFTSFTKNERSSQPIAYGHYDDGTLVMQTDWIDMSEYGLARKDEKYYPTDDKRQFIKIPFIDSCEGSKDLKQKMIKTDDILSSDKTRHKLFEQKDKDGNIVKDGEKGAKGFTYINIVREPQESDDYDGPERDRPDYMKVKFKSSWETKELTSQIIKVDTEMNEDGTDFVICTDSQGKLIRTDLTDKINTITDLEEERLIYKSRCRFLLMFSKVWKSSDKKYGTTWKIHKMEIAPKPRSTGNFDINADFDDEDSSLYVKKSSQPKKDEKKKDEKKKDTDTSGLDDNVDANDKEDSESESASDQAPSESESEEEPATTKKTQKKDEKKKDEKKKGKSASSSA